VDGEQLTIEDELDLAGNDDDGSWEWWWARLPRTPPDRDDLNQVRAPAHLPERHAA
jgi:hypothetical protein